MDRARKKTPEEMAMILDEIKKQKEKQKAQDDIRNVRYGRIIIFVLAGFMVISALAEYYTLNEAIEVWYIYAPLITIFLVLGIIYYRNPFVVSIVALSVYGFIILLSASADPSFLFKGIIIKAIIISGLIRAIKYGKDYNQAKKQQDSDLLDQNVFN